MLDFYKVKCTHVLDGDTFVGDISMGVFGMTLHDQIFHLKGVESPRHGEENYFESVEFTAQHIEDKEITVYIHRRDGYKNWIVAVYIENRYETLNDLLVMEGLAKTKTRGF